MLLLAETQQRERIGWEGHGNSHVWFGPGQQY